MFNKEEALKKFHKQEDKIVFAHLLDLYKMSEKTGKMQYSHFIDPYHISVFLQALYDTGCCASAFGGHSACERKIIAIGGNEWDLEAAYPIGCLRITKAKKAPDLSHRDYLGAVLGLGIDRIKIGDIFVQNEEAYCFVHEDICDYIALMLTQVARTNVTTEQIPLDAVIWEEDVLDSASVTVSSLRVDAVVAAGFRLSRSKSQELIQKEKVFINYQATQNSGQALKENDMITVRGLGRIKLKCITGKTKKGRMAIVLMKYN